MNTLQQIADIESHYFQDAWDEVAIEGLLKSAYNGLLLETTDEQVMGYCLYSSVFETAEILRIATHPNFTQQGIAQRLLDSLLVTLVNRQAETLMLEVRSDNTPAIAFYHKNGFKLINTRKGYYKNANGSATDAMIMQKIL
ncbi:MULTISPECIES: ribosomal protein S18-alanine N-acetyltransferase [unclassified Moraxella]|uniref:ribosomal protein S18-alanine N-acetyltransferase n=1 Tax=unclassified Moraxella TaxID=2685852 RepID=UPI003AF582DA